MCSPKLWTVSTQSWCWRRAEACSSTMKECASWCGCYGRAVEVCTLLQTSWCSWLSRPVSPHVSRLKCRACIQTHVLVDAPSFWKKWRKKASFFRNKREIAGEGSVTINTSWQTATTLNTASRVRVCSFYVLNEKPPASSQSKLSYDITVYHILSFPETQHSPLSKYLAALSWKKKKCFRSPKKKKK